MTTARDAAIINHTIIARLSSVGDGLMPQSKHNRETLAWNYMVASKIEKFGRGMKDNAKKEAIKAGVLFDHETAPLSPGTDMNVFRGDVVSINLTVKKPAQTFDYSAFRIAMSKAGLFTDAVEGIAAASFKESRPSHTYIAELLST